MAQFKLRTPADIGALIRDRRRAQDLDQVELAERIGVKRLWVNQVERGKPGASLGLVLRALAAVGVDIWSADVVEGKENGEEKSRDTTDINAIVAQARRKSKP
jgi:HTH-type transcriptional regulator / antitoxin HipB